MRGLSSITVYPSRANFLLFRTPHGQAPALFAALKHAGILVKNLDGSHPALADCLRVTVGKPEENDAFLAALAGTTRWGSPLKSAFNCPWSPEGRG
jgi:histidinol-phosphate aminotransferase